MKIMVTGGAGFIGSALIRFLLSETEHEVFNVDKLTYAGNLESLPGADSNPRYRFSQLDICDQVAMARAFEDFQPDAIMHLAAESHVDRSIDGPAEFVQTNILGTYVLLEVFRAYLSAKGAEQASRFRFHHISTDEVFGDLGEGGGYFDEHSSYNPSSPYSASKASADHLVRAWNRTYGLPTIITNCSNNYGPYQFPEKLIPLVILNALEGKPLPVYGQGMQVRDWLYVDDHARALYQVLTEGAIGETYTIGGNNERRNIDVVKQICFLLDEYRPRGNGSHSDLISFVGDRPGHDARYAIDTGWIQKSLGWKPNESFETGLRKTVQWYLNNTEWCQRVQDGSYRRERLGHAGRKI